MFRSLRKMFNFTQKNNTGTGDNSGNASVRDQLWDRDLGKVHNAAAEGDLVRLEKLLTKKKKDINKLDKKRRTALQIACAAGHDRVVEFLVDRNAALNLCDDTNQSALMKAVQGGHLMCVEILLVYDADVTLKDISGDTALHMAAGTSCVKTAELLLKHGAEINAPNVDGHTPLSVALHHDHTEMVKFLLERGADANATENFTEKSALMKAAQRGQHHMLQLLLAYGADVLQQDFKGWSAKDYAVKEQHQACAQLLIKHAERSCDGASNLQHRGQHETGTSNNAESVLKAPRMPTATMFRSLRKTFNFTKKNNTGTGDNSGNASVRHQLWDRDLGKVHNAAAEGDLVRLEKLLTKKKKDINKLDKKRRTALQIACAAGHDRVVEFLVDRNAALNLCDDTNQSALMKAVQGGHLMCVEILLVYDADVTLKDISGDTALHMAAGTSCVKTAELLLKHGAEINAPNVDGHTPLSVALHHDHTEMVKFLLERGADANATEKCTEMSALMKAAQRGQHHMLQLLLAYGADVLQQNCKGWSAKDYAVKEQHQACAQLLIKHAERSCDGASNLQHRGQHETGTSNNAESVLKAPRMPMSQEEESEHPLSTALNHRTSEGPSLNKSAEASVQEENLIQAMLDDYDLDYEADDSENFTSETASEQPHVSTSQDKINTNDENDGEQYEPDQQTSPSEAAEASVELNTTPSLPEDLPTTSVPSKPCKTSEPSNKHEIREKQKLEVNSQKLRILTDTINQQEDHREILKLLEQERSARALQEDQLNFLLCKQQEIEAENKQNINKCNEALSELSNARDRESQLLQQTVTLQRKIEDLEHIQGTGTLKERQLQEENEQLSRELHVQKELASELDRDLQAQKELVNKHNTTEEILAQVDRENQSLRRQLEEVQKQRDAEQRAMANAQQHFSDMMFKLRTDCDEKVQLVEERNKDLLSKARDLQDQVYTLEKKLKNDGKLRQLQQELSQTLTELSKKEVALDSKTRQCTVLENEKTRVLRKVDGLKEQMAQSEDQCLKIERRYNSLKSSFEEEECAIATQRLQETLSTSAASAATIKDLEEAVQRLEIQNVQLEKSAQQQSFKMETLEREAQKAAEVRAHLQKLVFNLQSSKLSLEEQLSRKELELEKQKVAVDPRLEQEMTRTSDLQAEVHRLHTLVKKKQLQDNDVRGEKIKDLEVQLDRETQRCHQLQKDNSDLHEKQTSLKCSLQKSQEEVQDLRTRMEAAQRECRLVEERTREKMDTIVQEINYHIRIQAAKWEAEFSQKIRELESLVSMARSREQDCLCQLDSILAELEMYKSTYSEEFHRPVTLSETNICLSEVSISTLRRERNMDRAQDKASPSQSLGNSGLNQSPGIPQHSPAMPGQSRGTEDFLTQMRRELDRSIDVELRRSTVNLEMPTDHLSPIDRTMREYRQVLQKNYQI